MTRPIDWISTDPGSEPLGKARLSIDQFNDQAQEHLYQMEEMKQRLETISQVFDGKGTILPIICREANSCLFEFHNRVDGLCELLDKTSRLPLILTALRYDLLYELCLAKERIRKLEDSIDSYSMTCMSPSSHSFRTQIFEAFQNLFQQVSLISQQFVSRSEDARFQEKVLIELLEKA